MCKLEQNGENSYSLYFANDARPYLVDKNGARTYKDKAKTAPTALKGNYTIKIEVWAVGTYRVDENGKARPLGNAKPLVLNQKIIIQP